MSAEFSNQRLSGIKTHWTMVLQAHQGQGDGATTAQQRLLLCYYGAVHAYLRAMVHDPEVAAELAQDFSVRFLRGDFRRADPQRGRFRDLVKTAARHLALDHWRREQLRKKKGPGPLQAESVRDDRTAVATASCSSFATRETETVFFREWRQSLLTQAWTALAHLQKRTGSLYHTLLHYKIAHPEVRSEQLAQQLQARLGRPFTAASVRQILRRARDKFADYLVAAVARSLRAPSPEDVERELVELGLLVYCQDALQRLRQCSSHGQT